MARYPGNIRKFPTTNPTQSSAPGVWTMSEQIDSQRRGIWPTERDPYYNYTALHIPGNIPFTSGPNSINKPLAYNSDASPNNFNIVQNGDVRATNFHPYQNNFSGYFNGASKLVFGSSTAWTFGTGDFTVEYFLMLSTLPSGTISFIDMRQGGANTNHIIFQLTSSAGIAVYIGSTPEVSVFANNILKAGEWVHIANVRDSGILKLYCNGKLVGKTACTTNIPAATPSVGGEYLGANYLTGYISNLRVSKSARYNNNFTPPTSRLSSEGASILALTGNRFIDQTNNTTISVNTGSPQISSAIPFVEYDTTSGSGYFQGSTSVWLNAPDNAALELGSNDFTIECWVYSTADFSSNRIFTSKWNNFVFGIIPTPVLYFAWYGNTNGSATGTLISTALNVWHHFAVCRQGNTLYMFQNGQKLTQSTSSITSTLNNDSYGTMIGGNENVVGGVIASANEPWYGYISDYRFVNGTALYTASFTLPTRPLTAVSNTSLLTLQTRAPANNNGFIDSSPNNFLITRNGNTTQGSFSPFSPSGWSHFYNGSSSHSVSNNSDFQFGTGDFSVELWLNKTVASTSSFTRVISIASTYSASGKGVELERSHPAGTLEVVISGDNSVVNNIVFTSTEAEWTNVWNHVVVTRSGNVLRGFWNGVLKGSVSNSTNINGTGGLRLGDAIGGSLPFTGFISDVKIVKGAVPTLYQTSSSTIGATIFAPPTAPVSWSTGTVFLTAQNNRFIETTGKTLTNNGTPQIIPFSPFAPASTVSPLTTGGSSYYDSSGDYLSIASNPALNFSGDFCIEGWAYPTSSIFGIAYKYVGGNVGSSEWYFVIDGTWQLSIALVGGGGEDYFRTSSNTITPYAWNHCVVTRSGTAVRLFINGILQSYNTTSRTLNATGTQVVVGGNSNFLSGVRITKDTIPILYQTSHTSTSTKIFDPPTSPPTAITGTSLLLNFTNASLVDVTGKTNFETSGQVQVSTSQTKFNYLSGGSAQGYTSTGNGFLRGNILSNWIFLHDGSTWTIEFWIYPTTLSGFQGIFCTSGAGSDYIGFHAAILNGGTITASQVRGVSGSATNFTSNTSLVVNSWNYVGITFLSSTKTCSFYINGAAAGSSSNTGFSYSSSNPTFLPHIGQTGEPTYPYYFNGYISDLRVTRGIARNVSSIPTRPFALA